MSYVSFGDDPSVADLVQAGASLLQPGGYPLPTPADTFNQILASSPVQDAVTAAWAPINDAVQSSGLANLDYNAIQKDPSKAVTGLAQALPDVLNNMGIDAGDLGNQLMVVAAGNVGTLVNGQPGPLVHAAIATSASYACQAAGIPPEAGTLAVDAVWKGEIDENTIEAAGAIAGAIAGAAIGCYFGIPPMIGAFLGSVVGKNVGTFMSDVFDVGGGQEAREKAHADWANAAQNIQGQLSGVRDQYINLLMARRGEYWALFDRIIDNISYQWQALECNYAHSSFPLLWSGTGNVNPYFVYPYLQSTCAVPINQNLSRGTGCLNSYGTLPNILGGGCGAIYGCQYPTLPSMTTGDPYRDRVVQAFAAYDIWWVPPAQRQAIDLQWSRFFAEPGAVSTDLAWNKHVVNTADAQWEWANRTGSTGDPKTGERLERAQSLLDNSVIMNIPGTPIYKAWANQWQGKYHDTTKDPTIPCPPYVPMGQMGCRAYPFNDWATYWAEYRTHCKDYALRNPNDCEAMCDKEIKGTLTAYRNELMLTMTAATDLRSIQAAAVRIAADLVSTAGVYAGAAKINADRSNLVKGKLDRAIAQNASDQALIIKKNSDMGAAVRYGKRKNAAVNYAMLALGGGVLAASFMRRR